GIVAFRREKYVAEGGPAGGDGGRGGNVIFKVDSGMSTLMDFRYQKHFKADKGIRGKNKTMHGANADHMVVKIPPGTIIYDDNTHEVIADMTKNGQEVIVAQGGRGGRGNARFATPKNPAPEIAENGEEGQERWIYLELKVIADVGLVGYPSVGKSTLLSIVSAATPKIADYHFTTLSPNLGVVDVGDGRSFVMADLPGLIEGAHEGIGLGHEFLRHVERTRVIVHVIDMSGLEGRDPYEDWIKINEELFLFNPLLAERHQVIVANKMDLPESAENLRRFREILMDKQQQLSIFPISAVTKQGIQEVLYKVADILASITTVPVAEEAAEGTERITYRLNKRDEGEFTVSKENEGFVVESPSIEKLIKRTNFSSREAVLRFSRIIRKMGVDEELRKLGAVHGQMIRIGDYEFEFDEKE
ncbi:MAG TPA: GTPase ObgE, partial [Bacilli bacterium]